MVILSLTALVAGAYGATITANYYKFYSSLHTITVNLTSFYWVADNRSLNGTVTFNLANPSDYKGLGLAFFKMTWEIDGLNGKEKMPQGAPNLPLYMPRTLDPTKPITIDLQGGGVAPQRVTLIRSISGDIEFLFSVDLGISSFLNSQATSIDSFDCVSSGGPGTCQLIGTEIIPVPTAGGGGGGGGGN
ncbi:hypothetical protein E6H29_02105 [Candidatus Bathyarchaeota archaeon]|nr:MAG: hypothetical protein E6H29_02105 [Candidatus Bathyarchaeota archaeon]